MNFKTKSIKLSHAQTNGNSQSSQTPTKVHWLKTKFPIFKGIFHQLNNKNGLRSFLTNKSYICKQYLNYTCKIPVWILKKNFGRKVQFKWNYSFDITLYQFYFIEQSNDILDSYCIFWRGYTCPLQYHHLNIVATSVQSKPYYFTVHVCKQSHPCQK